MIHLFNKQLSKVTGDRMTNKTGKVPALLGWGLYFSWGKRWDNKQEIKKQGYMIETTWEDTGPVLIQTEWSEKASPKR